MSALLALSLSEQGWLNVSSGFGANLLENLRDSMFHPDRVGIRSFTG
jgi:hypothetical protein